MRSEGDLQIAISAVVKVDLIADIQPQSDRTYKSLYAAAGIEGSVVVAIASEVEHARIAERRRAAIRAETQHAAFGKHKGAKWSFCSQLKLRSKKETGEPKARAAGVADSRTGRVHLNARAFKIVR